jgi:glycosyltransferase involved in cell wall biosynthesis
VGGVNPATERDTNPSGSDQPLVSVIVPTYNGAAFLKTAVDSVLDQTYPSVECIVIDDGSTDATPSIIESFGDRVRGTRQSNRGFGYARNRGARLARGELLSFLDHDDCWRPTKIERQVRRLAERPEVAVVYTAVELIDAHGDYLGIIPAPPADLAFRNTLLMEWPHLALEQGALIRREAFVQLGCFDERLTTSIGCDLACRLASTYPIEPIDEPLAAYRQHAEQMHHDLSRLEHDMRLVHAKVADLDHRHRPLLRRARYNLHMCLAHWYWRDERRPHHALWHAGQALLARPVYAAARLGSRRSRSSVSLQLSSKRP